jgi:hypothetical protein
LVDQNLLQIGTESIIDQVGQTHHYAWYELFPAYSVLIDRPVRAGDNLTASIICVAECAPDRIQTWKLVISNNTRRWNWSKAVAFKTPMESAEWIVESTGDEHLPLNDYGRITWTDLITNNSPAVLTGIAVSLQNPKSRQTSTPSVPRGNSFSTCWGFGSFTPC